MLWFSMIYFLQCLNYMIFYSLYSIIWDMIWFKCFHTSINKILVESCKIITFECKVLIHIYVMRLTTIYFWVESSLFKIWFIWNSIQEIRPSIINHPKFSDDLNGWIWRSMSSNRLQLFQEFSGQHSVSALESGCTNIWFV